VLQEVGRLLPVPPWDAYKEVERHLQSENENSSVGDIFVQGSAVRLAIMCACEEKKGGERRLPRLVFRQPLRNISCEP